MLICKQQKENNGQFPWSTLTKFILMGFAKGVTQAQAQAQTVFSTNVCERHTMCVRVVVCLLMLFWRLLSSSSWLAFPFWIYVAIRWDGCQSKHFVLYNNIPSAVHPIVQSNTKDTLCRKQIVNKLIEHKWKQMTVVSISKVQGDGFFCQKNCIIKYEICG